MCFNTVSLIPLFILEKFYMYLCIHVFTNFCIEKRHLNGIFRISSEKIFHNAVLEGLLNFIISNKRANYQRISCTSKSTSELSTTLILMEKKLTYSHRRPVYEKHFSEMKFLEPVIRK